MERLNKMKRKLTEVRGQNKKRTGKYLKIKEFNKTKKTMK